MLVVGKSTKEAKEAGDRRFDFECIIQPQLHHWSFNKDRFVRSHNSWVGKDGVSCDLTKTPEAKRRYAKYWKVAPMGLWVMPPGQQRMEKTFPLPRAAYWSVSAKKEGGSRCPITCDAGYRLKDPNINEYVCMGPTTKRDVKYKQDGVDKIKTEYHNSFGHLLCELDSCNIPAGRNYNKNRSGDGYCKLDGNSVAAAEGCRVACATGYILEDQASDKVTCKNGKLMGALPRCVPDPNDANHPNYGFTKSAGSFQFEVKPEVLGITSLISRTTELVTSQIKTHLGCTSETECTNGKPPTISSLLKRNSGVDTIHIFYEYWVTSERRRLSSGFQLLVPDDITAVAVMRVGPTISGAGTCTQSLDKFAADMQLDLTQCATTLTNEDGATCLGSCPLGQEPVDDAMPITVTCSLATGLSVENAICVSTRCFVGDFDTNNFSGFFDTCDYDPSTKTIKKTGTEICKAAGCRPNHTIYFNDGITCGSKRELTSKTICVPTSKAKCFLSSDALLKNADGSDCNIYEGVDIDASCKVSCIDGYKLKENTTFELKCGATGFISTPECVKATVPEVDSSSVASLASSVILLSFLASVTISIDAL